MNYENRIEPGDRLETTSLRNTRFVGEFIGRDHAEGHDVVKNTITGRAFVIAESEIVANTEDPMIEHLTLHNVITPRDSMT